MEDIDKTKEKETMKESYLNFQKRFGAKAGDIVRINGCAGRGELGWAYSWVYKMDETIGKKGVVMHSCTGKDTSTISNDQRGVLVEVEGGQAFYYPFYCLDMVERAEKEKSMFWVKLYNSAKDKFYLIEGEFLESEIDRFFVEIFEGMDVGIVGYSCQRSSFGDMDISTLLEVFQDIA
jgi:hypothetical protein